MKLVFMIGSGRCGSSLLHEIIARHKGVGFVSNIEDNFPALSPLGRFNNAIFRSPLGGYTKKGSLRFAPSEAYKLIRRDVSPIYELSCRNLRPDDVTPDLRARFTDFFRVRFEAQNKAVFVHKYTGWSRAAFFKEIFPEARFVHIIRDGRAVANSFLQMDWWTGFQSPKNWYLGPLSESDEETWLASDRSFVTLAGLAWRILVDSVESDAASLGGDLMELRYEDFLKAPEETVRAICEFSELEYNSDLERQMAKNPVRSGRKQAYLTDLSSEQVGELTRLLAPTLARYGYSA